jgi:hypothetical protein
MAMSNGSEAERLWKTLLEAYPRRTRFELNEILAAFYVAIPHRKGDADSRPVLSRLLGELEQCGVLKLPQKANRRAYDHSERTPLPKHIIRCDRRRPVAKEAVIWRPELSFASAVGELLQPDLLAIQEWLRRNGPAAPQVALRERSVEIFGDEKRLDALLGTQLFAAGHLTLDLLRCYLPAVPIYVVSIPADEVLRPLLVVENHTTFDTLCRWNEKHRNYAAIAFGAGAAFVAGCGSLKRHLAAPGCSNRLLYFGDLDPKGIWIPVRASQATGISVLPDEDLYERLLEKGRCHKHKDHEPYSFDVELLEWLPEKCRARTKARFTSGQRLPQELLTLHDL